MLRVLATKWGFVLALPCLSTKNRPAWSPLEPMYCKTADMGQRRLPVRPTMMSDPAPEGSHFELLRWNCIICGHEWLSTATSPHARHLAGWNAAQEPGSSSPNLKKLKKAVAAMAQNASLSGSAEAITWCQMPSRMCAVMGSLILLGWEPFNNLSLLIPACTRFSTGRDDWSLGSGSPSEI